MKPTLALSILLAMSAIAPAQTPTVVEKPGAKPANANVKVVPQTPAKPSPTNVKVVPVPQAPAKPLPTNVKVVPVAQKPAAAAPKPAVVSVTPVPAKPVSVQAPKATSAVAVKPVSAAGVKPVSAAPSKAAVPAHPVAVAAQPAGKPGAAPAKAASPKTAPAQAKDPFAKQQHPVAAKSASASVVAVQDTKPAADDKKPETKKISAAGRRDPFVSPVVNLGAIGSGCSSGKRCLAIDQIALKGIVKSDTGMIAVVVNAMDKAYFLRENDPVFNGFVVKITGDSIVFKETFKDKLGKPLTRDVTKTISRPLA